MLRWIRYCRHESTGVAMSSIIANNGMWHHPIAEQSFLQILRPFLLRNLLRLVSSVSHDKLKVRRDEPLLSGSRISMRWNDFSGKVSHYPIKKAMSFQRDAKFSFALVNHESGTDVLLFNFLCSIEWEHFETILNASNIDKNIANWKTLITVKLMYYKVTDVCQMRLVQ